jgi:hypothetical protein
MAGYQRALVGRGAGRMAVMTVTTVTLKPGRLEDYLEQSARPAKRILGKVGATNVRVVTTESSNTVVFVAEYESWTAMGAATDKFFSDPDTLALMANTDAADGPIVAYQQSVVMDIPL